MHNNLGEIKVWEKAIALSTEIYAVTQSFPKEELYGLISQMRRCSVSIASNIAEGSGRSSKKEFIYFLKIANGSSYELQTQIIISNNLNYINQDIKNKLINNINEIQKMIFGFIKTLSK